MEVITTQDYLALIFQNLKGRMLKAGCINVSSFFELDAIAETWKVKVASIHLLGRALVWHQAYMRNFWGWKLAGLE